MTVRRLARSIPVVVGMTALAAGLITVSSPAFAQFHPSEIGTGIGFNAPAALPAGVLVGSYAAEDSEVSSCALRYQQIWDGYAWRVQRMQVCN